MDEEEQRYLREAARADLGRVRRQDISIAEDDEEPKQHQWLQPQRPHGVGQPFRQPQGQGQDKEILSAWSNLRSTIGDNEEELDSIMGGQSHREKLNSEVLHSFIGRHGPPPQQQHHNHHRDSGSHKPQPPKMGYKPVYKSATKPPPYSRAQPPSTVRPPLTSRAPPAAKPSPALKSSPTAKLPQAGNKSPAPKPSQAFKQPPNPRYSSTFKQPPAPQQPSNQGRRKFEHTRYNLPQPQTSDTAFQPQRQSEEDLLTFDSPPSGKSSHEKSPAKVYESASMSDLMEIDDGEMLTNKTTMTGPRPSNFASPGSHDTARPQQASTGNPQALGLMASRYATSNDNNDPATEGSIDQGETQSNEISYWQQALPRSVQNILKEKSNTSVKKSSPLSQSRWAH